MNKVLIESKAAQPSFSIRLSPEDIQRLHNIDAATAGKIRMYRSDLVKVLGEKRFHRLNAQRLLEIYIVERGEVCYELSGLARLIINMLTSSAQILIDEDADNYEVW